MKYILITAALIGTIALNSYAQQAPPALPPVTFSLADCIKYAYEHQDSVKNASLDVQSAGYKVKETIGSGLPQINGTISFRGFY
ncbi:hypothetical protein [Mucilaginibacter humi]|uniref:hypothetical protein n=1 Tax=Mucilaginibacter humi TaxID=2732510 RepID=UPI001FE8BDA0|nr:hypothetical protein [Mucilaginibacter humi]